MLEYACAVWDPWQITLSEKLEKIQNRAARFALNRYSRNDSCTNMKSELGWLLLSSRRRKLRLKLLYQIFHGKTGIRKDMYLHSPHYVSSRNDHCFKILEYRSRSNLFANSFFVRSISEWNRLLSEQVCCINEDVFFLSL